MGKRIWSKRARLLAVSFLAAAFAVTAGFAVQGQARAAQYRHLMNNSYHHAFTELTTAVGELEVALQKGLYTSTPPLFSSLCAQAYSKALAAQIALGELPYSNLELEQTATFLAKTGDYAMSLSRNAYQNRGCTAEDREMLRSLAAGAGQLAQTLRQLQNDIYAGAVTLEDLRTAEARLSAATESGDTTADSAYQTVETDFPEVPTLIYDGPFSEHIAGRTPKLLEGLKEVTQEQAQKAAGNFLDLRPEVFDLVCESDSKIPTWCFAATVSGGELYVEVTKVGGLVLQVVGERLVQEDILSLDEARQLASEFLTARGYPNMSESYFIDQDNILTINYAATQDGVLLYPDLIKVAVALDTGSIVGFEAEGYLMNHCVRQLPTPAIGEEQARQAVTEGLNLLSHQIALIPTGGEYEVLCHEFKCETGEGQHVIVYVNAVSGQEEKILLLLEDESGTLAI